MLIREAAEDLEGVREGGSITDPVSSPFSSNRASPASAPEIATRARPRDGAWDVTLDRCSESNTCESHRGDEEPFRNAHAALRREQFHDGRAAPTWW